MHPRLHELHPRRAALSPLRATRGALSALLPQEGADVTLRNVQPGVLAVLELLRLHRIFKVE